MAESTSSYRVEREGYTYKGQGLPVGTVVELTQAQVDGMTQSEPPYLVPVKAAEAKAARATDDVVVLNEVPDQGEPVIEEAKPAARRK